MSASPKTDPREVLVVVCVATFFGVLNASAVNVVLPEMGRTFSVGPALLGWVMSIFLLTYGVAIPFYGRLADRVGTRRLFIFGLALFGIGSLGCALAPSIETLLGARVVQGLGGAAFPGLGMAIVSRAYPPARRGTALGFVAATMGVGAAVGPLVGGFVADLVSWRLLFAASALATFVIPLARTRLPREEVDPHAPADLLGGASLAASVAALLYAVAKTSRLGLRSEPVLWAAGIGLGAFAAFTLRQSTVQDPFIPRSLLRTPAYRSAVAMAFLSTGSYLAMLIGLPLLLARYFQMSPLQVAFVLLPQAIGTAVTGVLAGRVVDRIGPRVPTLVGAAILIATVFGLSTFGAMSVTALVVLGASLGIGYALLNTPIIAAIGLSVEPKLLPSALSLNAMVFFIGGSFGTTAFVSLSGLRDAAASAWNPLHEGAAFGFSDAALTFVIPTTLIGWLALNLPHGEIASSIVDTPQTSSASNGAT